MVEPLNSALFTTGAAAVNWAELVGIVTGGLRVTLTVRRNIRDEHDFDPIGPAWCSPGSWLAPALLWLHQQMHRISDRDAPRLSEA
ncbi:hypothetical protein [Mycolicibacterium lutetiense]